MLKSVPKSLRQVTAQISAHFRQTQMKHFVFLFVVPLALIAQTRNSAPAASRPAPGTAAVSDDSVVLTVGSERITKSQFEAIVATLPANQRSQLTTPAARRRLADEIGRLEALATEARARKLDQDPSVREMLRMQDQSLLANTLVKQQMAVDGANSALLHDYYDKHKDEFDQIKADHILIRFQGSRVPLRKGEKELTDAEALARAQEIRQKLAQGGDFAQIAKTESDDAGSAENGGALPPFGPGEMVPAFAKAAAELKPGEISQPVKTEFGYHIIKLVSHETKPFDQAQHEIEQKMAQAFIEKVSQQFPITLDESYFGK